jgi:hypothetical protein
MLFLSNWRLFVFWRREAADLGAVKLEPSTPRTHRQELNWQVGFLFLD